MSGFDGTENVTPVETGAVGEITDNATTKEVNYGPTIRKTFNDVGPMSMNVLRDVPDYTHICYDIVNKFLGQTKSLQRFSDRIVPHGMRDWTRKACNLIQHAHVAEVVG